MTLARCQALTALVIATLGLAACGGDQPAPQQPQSQEAFQSDVPQPTPAPAPMDTSAAPQPAPAPTAAATATPPPEEALTDQQIAAIVSAANTGEIAQAKVAQQNAKAPKVKQFATHMVTEHGQAQADTEKLLKKIGLTPAEGELSRKIAGDSGELVTRLKAQKGSDFDKSYIDAQVEEHQAVLGLMDAKLIPQAQNAELKAAIQGFRPKVEHHLAEAKSIQASLVAK